MWLYFFLLFWGGLRASHIRHVYAVRIVSTGHKRGKMYALAHTHGVLMFLYIHTHHAHWWCDDAGMCLDVRMSHTCGLVCYTNNNYRIIRYTYYYTKALVYNRDTAAHFFLDYIMCERICVHYIMGAQICEYSFFYIICSRWINSFPNAHASQTWVFNVSKIFFFLDDRGDIIEKILRSCFFSFSNDIKLVYMHAYRTVFLYLVNLI